MVTQGARPRSGCMKFTVAVDGPAAAGKRTIGSAVAKHFGFFYLDTGLLYRAVAKRLLDEGLPVAPEAAARIAREQDLVDITGESLRANEVSRLSSHVAAIPEVRSELLDLQRRIARRDGGAVLDGRDIGTVICPEADVKLFITASLKVRALRRFEELVRKGVDISIETVEEELGRRDDRDRERPVAALQKAEDAILINSTRLPINATIERAIAEVASRYEAAGPPQPPVYAGGG